MRKIFLIIALFISMPAIAYDTDHDCPVCLCDVAPRRDNYTGFRLYKNEHSAFKYSIPKSYEAVYKQDNFGFGTTLGNRLNKWVRVEYETMYMGSSHTKNGHSFDYDIWTNMLNAYLMYDIAGNVAPYIGAGLGLTALWGEIDGDLDNAVDLSYQFMLGVVFSLNSRIDLEVGFKYEDFGKIEHSTGISRVDATQFYLGASYRFGM